eukprot:1178915-Prorocentrum_minimum.AAC.2
MAGFGCGAGKRHARPNESATCRERRRQRDEGGREGLQASPCAQQDPVHTPPHRELLQVSSLES